MIALSHQASRDSHLCVAEIPLRQHLRAHLRRYASGAVALLLNADPSLTPDQVKALLMLAANKNVLPQTSTVVASGVTYTAHNDPFTVGAGYLDINAAVKDALAGTSIPSGTAMSPIAGVDSTGENVTLVTDSTALWGRSTTFGAANIYGPNAFVGGSTALWGRSVLEGASDANAFTALWGSTALWGRNIPEAATALWGRSTTTGASTSSVDSSLWGATTLTGSTALWSTTVFLEQ